MKGIMTDLKRFMIRRRTVDIAAGLVLAGAFRQIIVSLVNDVILPPVSYFTSGANISNLSYVLKKSPTGLPLVSIGYGKFIQTAIDFVILGVAISMVLRAAEKVTAEDVKARPKSSQKEALLKEIRDLLKSQKNPQNQVNSV